MAEMTLATVGVGSNSKTGLTFNTYRPVGATCPAACPLLGSCYAGQGHVGMIQRKAADRADNVADWMRKLPARALVRHLVSGDLFGPGGEPDAGYIGEMLRGHDSRRDVTGWAYTHGWRSLDAAALRRKNLVVNASVDKPADVPAALAAGWDAAVILPLGEDRKVIKGDGYTVVTCPNQTVGMTCDRCLLCARPNRMHPNGTPLVVGFRPHGRNAATVAAKAAGEGLDKPD